MTNWYRFLILIQLRSNYSEATKKISFYFAAHWLTL
jgi:hypothetical protein